MDVFIHNWCGERLACHSRYGSINTSCKLDSETGPLRFVPNLGLKELLFSGIPKNDRHRLTSHSGKPSFCLTCIHGTTSLGVF